ncbi:hypothetical protein J0A67_09445 [Algoriphagus aestuariicola]|uniref:Uncharacterized protein n=1 Tax=Algoriphagus aestuariicola TaxID=1852016 RepID=A0ABS3BP95_9BACT|nr:hypothetical protein [Algoriphagus aestuariicola]MBN7801086.1 hypothetical protein [Algoriphagus aestuariicola]
MEPKRILTLMTFPQRLKGNILTVNIVVVPRNTDPFAAWPTGLSSPLPTQVPGFANLQPKFKLAIVKGTDDFPLSNATAASRKPILTDVTEVPAANKANILQQIAGTFTITDNSDKMPDPVPLDQAGKRGIKKYLPFSYRTRFNFTQPRHPNAVTDDSYHCAVRDKVDLIPNYVPKNNVSWGKVFANILRQPILAKACGMIYEVELEIQPEWFENGGYLYADIVGGDYETAQNASLEVSAPAQNVGPLVKRYASKVPELVIGEDRPVFAPVLFPVLYQKSTELTEPIPAGPWDELFLEAHLYNDGFAKIVHANQAESGNLLEEKPDGLPPQSDSGIRMGWDDEQILVWYLRQILENPGDAPGSNKRLDAPLGVMGYHIDVQEAVPGAEWESLNVVQVNPAQVGLASTFANQTVELPYQVYPTKIAGPSSDGYWLPMYYAYWIGKSLSTEDKDAVEIYRNDQEKIAKKQVIKPTGEVIEVVSDDAEKVIKNTTLVPGEIKTLLRYGNTYRFRIRLADISGGGPSLEDEPLNPAPSPNTSVSFKRYVNPGMLRIEKPKEYVEHKVDFYNSANVEDTEFKDGIVLEIERPLLEYPAVVFTDKYQKAGMDPIAMLKALPFGPTGLKPALPDPDVHKIQILVEVKSLKMDTQLSRSGRDSYIPLYSREWDFPEDFDGKIELPITFLDVPVLNLGEPADPFLSKKLEFDQLSETSLVLPTGRKVRVSFRALASSEEPEVEYFGIIDADEEKDSRYGKVQQLMFYKETQDEEDLLLPYKNIPELQALYLKPDPIPTAKQISLGARLRRKSENDQPDVVKRVADALGLASKGLTLMAKKGERVAFGCSSRIRHTLAPDGSSITFASKTELYYHWVTCLSYQLNRDWSWDGHQDVAFVIERKHRFRREPKKEVRVNEYLDDIEIKHTVSFEALQADNFDEVNRHYTRIIYIDALEPKNERKLPNSSELRYPDELWAEYTLKPQVKKGHGEPGDVTTELLKLPTVLNPSQTPKVVSVGLAFSPYERAEDYSQTEARKRFLWVEFEEAIQNPDDTYFCRMLANAPDQLISNNDFDLFEVPEEASLSLDPEVIRRIIPDQSDDKSGIDAMQMMVKSTDSDKHYLLPIPPGMHPESPEMFGFFTYEFRVGHAHFIDREAEDDELSAQTFSNVQEFEFIGGTPKGNLWSTAQGRFGREQRVTGMQHPVPTLLCSLNRDENHMYVSAPYAKAVFKGKNVTSKPPRTSLWTLLYAQVHQADGLDFRNILISEQKMRVDVKINTDPKKLKEINQLTQTTYFQPSLLDYNKGVFKITPQLSTATLLAYLKETHPVGTAVFTSQEIAGYLTDLGLPEDSPLSVLVVEVFGNIRNIAEHMNVFRRSAGDDKVHHAYQEARKAMDATGAVTDVDRVRLGDNLGNFRILRTSPLTKVPFVCCPTCE